MARTPETERGVGGTNAGGKDWGEERAHTVSDRVARDVSAIQDTHSCPMMTTLTSLIFERRVNE